ncbi:MULTISPECIES: sensor histidine kinase [Bacillus]|uniref:sensor histidine kinase n=1 Tax=Bacillus TaxID=1386 RepID=UPI0008FE698F|nr:MULTISPECIES: HAMP domain-containing sensor histidine kinase [Bacillus cereus group]MCU5489063.1 HAMP domain-containing histidine kinase [Bacillus cereus]MDF9466876.1 HAMP domain-containing sensor histidine kinase [Bacillus cereus]MED3268815.1 HAMP domain-containing sensor histidine kinase [Bacillus thuringiensis]MED3358692.1 HAMP domain-containing sensor histidine kinase [Bacillus thuringiensis]OJE01586.1 two-component sensor histidine kinase [Bacillus thuringiensis]
MKMKRITYKLFMTTSLILLAFATLIYVTLYFFLPKFYEQYKTDQLQTGIEEIIDKSKYLTLQNAIPLVDEYAQKNNAVIYLQNNEGRLIYSPSIAFLQSTIQEGTIQGGTQAKGFVKTVPARSLDNARNSYEVSKPIQFQDVNLTLVVFATFQPIDEASQVLVRFLPYISIIVLVIGLGSAYLYSRFITKPLIYINKGAQKMANLDFSEKIEVRSMDELGELSNSLNDMSINLQQAIFDLQKANQQLKSDIEKEREIETKRREFFAIVAHELKTPLTVMKGYLEGMIYNIGPYQNRDQYLNKNFQIIENLEQLVREILSMSRLEQHTFKLQVEEVNLSKSIDTITKKLEFFASQKGIQIIKEVDSDIFVYTDYVLLEKACKNIIHNAIMYSPYNEKVYIKLTKDSKQNNIQIRVINTGVKIKEEEIQHIFKPFYRIEKSRNRNTGGSGLGLYIVKQILESLFITYSMSNTKQGVQFLITIPLSIK